MSRTIVVPLISARLDPQGIAEVAVPVARLLGERTNAEILLLSVIEMPREFGALARIMGVSLEEQQQTWIAERQAYLSSVAERFPGRVVRTDVRLATSASLAILDVVASLPNPILVMASHARAGASRLLLGSVAFRTVHEATCPVILVHPSTSEVTALQKVLIPLDGSSISEQVLARVTEILGPAPLNVHLVHVVAPIADYYSVVEAEYVQSAQDWAAEYLQRVAAPLQAQGHQVTWEFSLGVAAEEINRVAQEQGVDLIAMATHGRAGAGRVLYGSVAEQVLHTARKPLLLIRPVMREA